MRDGAFGYIPVLKRVTLEEYGIWRRKFTKEIRKYRDGILRDINDPENVVFNRVIRTDLGNGVSTRKRRKRRLDDIVKDIDETIAKRQRLNDGNRNKHFEA